MARPSGFINYADGDCMNDFAIALWSYVVVDLVAYTVYIGLGDLRDQTTDPIFGNEYHLDE